jgi:hopanoid biosynthesis associated RND transporter like protein HpnN
MKSMPEHTLLARVLGGLARAVVRFPRLFFYPQVILFVACVFYTYSGLQFDMSRDNLVGSNKKYHQIYLRFKKEFPTQDDLVVVVQSEDAEKNRQFVERLGARLEAETNLFKDVFYKGDLKMLGSKALLFVPATNLVDLKKTLEEYRPFISRFTAATNLVSLFNMINTQFRTARDEKNAENDSLVKAIPALERIISQATDSLRRAGTPPSPGVTALFNPDSDAEREIYITFPPYQIYLVTAQAPSEDKNSASVARLRVLVEQVKAEVPGLNVGLTGEPVLEEDEMQQSQKDTALASVVSLVLCALIFIYGYQQTGRPVKATVCLIVGLGYTLAFATLAVGHLNILTVTFVPILIGLAIDYGVHLISRYEEELRHGKTEAAALEKAMIYTGQGIFTGALTTAGAFLAMWLTDFKGIQEMGIICGGGLIVCLIPMMTMLPVLLLRGRQNVIDHQLVGVPEARARIERLWLERPVIITILIIGSCVLAGTQLNKVYFDYNLLNMQSEGLPAVTFEKKLIDSTPKSVLFAAVIATNLTEAVSLEERIRKLPAVTNVDSIAQFLAEDQTSKLAIVGDIKQLLKGLRFEPPDLAPVDVKELSRTLYSTSGYLGQAIDQVQRDEPAVAAQLASLRQAIEDARKEMNDPACRAFAAARLGQFQQALFDDVRETFVGLQNQDNRAPLGVNDLPPALRDRFVGVTGKLLLMVVPREDVWQRDHQEEFVRELRQVDPNVTGTPVQLFEYTTLLKKSYEEAARYALVAIALMVFIHFRSALSVALALTPVAIGVIWLGGLMGWLGIPLNPANIMTLPLVIGIGVTNGIHILNRFAEERTPNILARSTGKAVLVSGLTALAGFGSLALAKHRGIQSLGYVMSSGIALCMLAALTFLPALLNLLTKPKKQPSADNAQSTLGREEPR